MKASLSDIGAQVPDPLQIDESLFENLKYINRLYVLLGLIIMDLQKIVDDRIMIFLATLLTEAKQCLQHDVARLTILKNKHRPDAYDHKEMQILEEMIQSDRDFVVEYERALESPNNWLVSSQPDVDYILKNWARNCSLTIDEASLGYRQFVEHMLACAELIFVIAGLWEPLPYEQRMLFLSFIDVHLHEHLQGMHEEIMTRRSAMGAVYTLLRKMWEGFHNECGEPFLISRHRHCIKAYPRSRKAYLWLGQPEVMPLRVVRGVPYSKHVFALQALHNSTWRGIPHAILSLPQTPAVAGVGPPHTPAVAGVGVPHTNATVLTHVSLITAACLKV